MPTPEVKKETPEVKKETPEIKNEEELNKVTDSQENNKNIAKDLENKTSIDFSKIFNVTNASSTKVDLLSSPEIKDKINNILKTYGISKPID
ncbi:TPA: hypothetical protein DIC40_04110 [Patescibacteria group bacterium]|nr:hypothetical protein [Candidatus Gracilibacteria bacterium]